MKEIIRSLPSAFLVLVAVFFSGGCSKSALNPDFSQSGEDAPAADAAEAPSVDEALAREAGQQRIIYHIGPVDLPAGTKAEAMLERPLSMRFQTDKAIWVVGFVPKVVDANGSELPAELLHHAVVFNMHEENPICAGQPNPFSVASSMLTEVNLPRGFGYPILPTDPIEARAVLANPTDKSYTDVYFEIALVAKPMNDFAAIRDVKPIYFELDPCTHAPMAVEPHAFSQKSATYQVPMKASLILAHAILEDYGSAVQLTAGKEVMPFWRAEGVQDEEHRVKELTANPFEDASGLSFNAGDPITIGVAYDNSSDAWLTGAVAGAMAYFCDSR